MWSVTFRFKSKTTTQIPSYIKRIPNDMQPYISSCTEAAFSESNFFSHNKGIKTNVLLPKFSNCLNLDSFKKTGI